MKKLLSLLILTYALAFLGTESKAQVVVPDTSGASLLQTHLDSLLSLPSLTHEDSCWVTLRTNQLNVLFNWPTLSQQQLDALYAEMQLMRKEVEPTTPSAP